MRALLLEFGGHYEFDVDPDDIEMYFEDLDDPLWWPLLEHWLQYVELTPMLLAEAAHSGWRAGAERMVAAGIRLTWEDAIEFGLEPAAFGLLAELGAPLPAPQTLRQCVIAGDVAGIEAGEFEHNPQLLENAIYGRSDAVAAALVRKGFKPASQERDMPTLAARFGLFETVCAFIDTGRPIDARGNEGTLLRNAAGWGQRELVRELLRRGADPTLTSIPAGDAEIMRALLDAGALPEPGRTLDQVAEGRVPASALKVLEEYVDLDFDTAQCRVALYKAAAGGHADALRAICRHCDPNLASTGTLASLSAPPLHVAARMRHHGALQALLDCGANPQRTAADNKTAYRVADLTGRSILRKFPGQ
jgi:ankyrin repeat protein